VNNKYKCDFAKQIKKLDTEKEILYFQPKEEKNKLKLILSLGNRLDNQNNNFEKVSKSKKAHNHKSHKCKTKKIIVQIVIRQDSLFYK